MTIVTPHLVTVEACPSRALVCISTIIRVCTLPWSHMLNIDNSEKTWEPGTTLVTSCYSVNQPFPTFNKHFTIKNNMNEILNPQISTHNTINLMKEVLRQVLSQRTYNESVAAETITLILMRVFPTLKFQLVRFYYGFQRRRI